MTCKDCIYRAMCYKHEHYGYGDENNEEPCEMFKNKADFAEVVRCKDCVRGFKKFIRNVKCIECQLYHHDDKRQYKELMDYCSHGVRKERSDT